MGSLHRNTLCGVSGKCLLQPRTVAASGDLGPASSSAEKAALLPSQGSHRAAGRHLSGPGLLLSVQFRGPRTAQPPLTHSVLPFLLGLELCQPGCYLQGREWSRVQATLPASQSHREGCTHGAEGRQSTHGVQSSGTPSGHCGCWASALGTCRQPATCRTSQGCGVCFGGALESPGIFRCVQCGTEPRGAFMSEAARLISCRESGWWLVLLEGLGLCRRCDALGPRACPLV